MARRCRAVTQLTTTGHWSVKHTQRDTPDDTLSETHSTSTGHWSGSVPEVIVDIRGRNCLSSSVANCRRYSRVPCGGTYVLTVSVGEGRNYTPECIN